LHLQSRQVAQKFEAALPGTIGLGAALHMAIPRAVFPVHQVRHRMHKELMASLTNMEFEQ
jgi:hypothetical protein